MAKTLSLFPILDAKQTSRLARTAAEAPSDSTGLPYRIPPAAPPSPSSPRSFRSENFPFPTPSTPIAAASSPAAIAMPATPTSFSNSHPKISSTRSTSSRTLRWLLTQELKRLKPGTDIALGTATDPYQPLERRQMVTRSMLEVFARMQRLRAGNRHQIHTYRARCRPSQGNLAAPQAHAFTSPSPPWTRSWPASSSRARRDPTFASAPWRTFARPASGPA